MQTTASERYKSACSTILYHTPETFPTRFQRLQVDLRIEEHMKP